jgi:hypothetical protein
LLSFSFPPDNHPYSAELLSVVSCTFLKLKRSV